MEPNDPSLKNQDVLVPSIVNLKWQFRLDSSRAGFFSPVERSFLRYIKWPKRKLALSETFETRDFLSAYC